MISFTNSFCTLRSHEFPSFLESIKASLRNFKTQGSQGMTDILSEQLSAKKCRFLDPLVDFQPSLWKKVVSYPPFSSSTVISGWKTLENLPIGQPFFVQMTGFSISTRVQGWALRIQPWSKISKWNGWRNSKQIMQKTVRNRTWISLQRQQLTTQSLMVSRCFDPFPSRHFQVPCWFWVRIGFAIPFLVLILWWFRFIRRSTCYTMLYM